MGSNANKIELLVFVIHFWKNTEEVYSKKDCFALKRVLRNADCMLVQLGRGRHCINNM